MHIALIAALKPKISGSGLDHSSIGFNRSGGEDVVAVHLGLRVLAAAML